MQICAASAKAGLLAPLVFASLAAGHAAADHTCPIAEGEEEAAGFAVFTSDDNPTVPAGTIVIRYAGPITADMAEGLATIWSDNRGKYARVLLDIDSPGGELGAAANAIEVLREVRSTARLDTLVRQGARCLSACVPVFAQGSERTAGNATAWLFHGACRTGTNVPSLAATVEYVELLREAGVAAAFLDRLVEQGYLHTPGGYWLSGYELHALSGAGIVTRLLDPWEPQAPRLPPAAPAIRPR